MNLKSLAQNLGISETTVSRALNGYPEVSARTRQRVLEAAEQFGYRPKNPVTLTDAERDEVEAFLDAIDGDDDVQHVYVGL